MAPVARLEGQVRTEEHLVSLIRSADNLSRWLPRGASSWDFPTPHCPSRAVLGPMLEAGKREESPEYVLT